MGEEEEYCPDCAAGHREFDQGRGIFLYDNKMKASLMKYKYFGSREYGQFYAKAMYTFAGKTIAKWKPDVLISVPLHPKKLRKRGFNQAGYLAKLLSGYTGIPFEEHLVRKTRETRAQKKLDAGARRKNLQDAFEASDRVKGLTLLVIDDVYTTGSTMDAMAGCLKKKGADKVYFLTVCIGIT